MPNRIQKKSAANASVAALNNINENDVRRILLENLEAVRGESYSELASQFSASGDVKTDSAEAEVMIVMLEEKLNIRLPKPSSLRAEQFTSVKSLMEVAMQRVRGKSNATAVRILTKTTA